MCPDCEREMAGRERKAREQRDDEWLAALDAEDIDASDVQRHLSALSTSAPSKPEGGGK